MLAPVGKSRLPEGTFEEKEIVGAWQTGRRIRHQGRSYRVGKMSYGDFFLEPGKEHGEMASFNRGTLWLKKVQVRNRYGFLQPFYEVWYEATGNPARGRKLDEVQELVFRLMEIDSFNEFDGPRVVAMLRANKKLWRAAFWTRDYQRGVVLETMMERRGYGGDTLWIVPEDGMEGELEDLMNSAEAAADEVGYYTSETMRADTHKDAEYELRDQMYWTYVRQTGRPCLRVWWD